MSGNRSSYLLGEIAAAMVVLCVVGTAWGTVIYVDANAPGGNDGSNWEDAYYYLQDALTFAFAGDEIRISQGLYRPDDFVLSRRPNMGRAETFRLVTGVVIKGGYAGHGAPSPNARDVNRYETILSGDLDDNDRGTIEADEATRQDNAYHVVTGSEVDETAVLDGLTVTGGNANGPYPDNNGGGVYNEFGSPMLIRCTIRGNSTSGKGGGINNYWSDPTVFECTLIDNWAGYDGGGMFNWMGHLVLTNCTFSGNSAVNDGGGMFTNHASFDLTNCTFSGNSAGSYGGGLYNAKLYGAAVLSNCILFGNEAHEGPEIGLSEIVTGGVGTFVDYCDIRGGRLDVYDPGELLEWGQGNIDRDPCFADDLGSDYHLKSEGGRWDAGDGLWMVDDVTSPCVDAGHEMRPIGLEPFPNGGIINMGAYGGTPEASKSYFDKPPCETILAGDVNGDCIIDFRDVYIMALHWCEQW